MTYTPADIGLAPDAAARLDDYLKQVRAALTGAADVTPDEIEADIREHVENELHGAPRPVPLSVLEAVLAKLGPPSQWGTAPDPTLFARARHVLREGLRDARAATAERARRVRFTLWNGPDDWRLAYLSFGVFALGVLTFFALFPVTLIVSYILSRAGLAVARERGIELGAGRKWLLYPPVVIVSAVLLVAMVAWPAAAGAIAFGELHDAGVRVRTYDYVDPTPTNEAGWRKWHERQTRKEQTAAQVEEDRKLLAAVPVPMGWAPTAAGWFVGFGAVMIWWTVLGFGSATFPNAVRAAFCPLCDRFDRRHGAWLGWTCLAVSVGWGVAMWDIARGAGWL